jgi:hypothetical protein
MSNADCPEEGKWLASTLIRDREAYVSKDPFERLLPPRGSGAHLRNEGEVQ